MSNRLTFGKHLLLSCSALFPVLLAGPGPAAAQAVNLGGAGNLIIPDGRTQTSVTNNGATTDIHTDTVRGQVGFNSFSQFQAGSGNTVNLHLPQNTGTLVNIVRDGPAVVEGTVNALKNGSIGGNVVFSDPYGFVLGKDGVINTGGLTVNTPTKEFIDGAIDASGRIDTSRTDRLISGDVPISPDGSVVIRGRINAETHIDIHARSIDIDSQATLRRHRENFEASVNTTGGVAQGGALVVRDGRIQLVATGDVAIGGSVAARATSRESASRGAGQVTVRAAGNVTITPTARIEALAAIAREDGIEAVTAIVGIEAGELLTVAGTLSAIGENGAGAAVNLAADRAAVKASALLSAQIAAGADRGTVTLAADKSLDLDGRIEARGADGTKGGRVNVTAGIDIALGGTASIDADGEGAGSAGGDIYVVATRDLSVADGASVSARGTGAADGGFAELSGHRTVSLGSVTVDLRSAGGGKAGTLLIDPEDLVVDAASSLTAYANTVFTADNTITVKSGGSIRSAVDGATNKAYDIQLEATTIIVESGGEIDSRALTAGAVTGHSGSIRLLASAIDLQAGSIVRADAAPGYTAGDVSLIARDTMIARSGGTNAEATINIAGTLKGRDIEALAVATARSFYQEVDFLDENYELATVDAANLPLLIGRFVGPGFALDGGYIGARTVATVTVKDTAIVDASRDLGLHAVGDQRAENLGINLTGGSLLQLAAFVGTLEAETAVSIASGAQVTVGENFEMTADNTAQLGVNAMNIGLKDTPLSGAVAVGVAEIRTSATVAAGATIAVGGNVRIAADNRNSFLVDATAMALKDGVAGVALAIHHHDATATAALDASIGGLMSGARTGDVSVTSVSETILNKTAASTTLGDSFVVRLLRNKVAGPLADKVGSKIPDTLSNLFKTTPVAALAQDEMPKGAVALSIGLGTQTATARIGAGVVLDAAGSVDVASSVLDSQVRSFADTSINSSPDPSNGPATTTGVGIAVAVADFDHVSHASIGNDAEITAANVGVGARSSLPINIAYQNASTPIEWILTLKNAANGNLGVVKNILTSYAASDVAAADTGIGASVNYLGLGHDVLAWVGSGASIQTNDATDGSRTVAMRGGVSSEHPEVGRDAGRIGGFTFGRGVDVQAESETETINIAGNPAWFIIIGGNESTSPEGKSFGGSFNMNSFSARTIAGIGAGATIDSAKDVRVTATRSDTVFSVAPTSGAGAGFGINGILSLVMVDNDTSASISNTAIVKANSVALDARQQTQIVSIAGSINRGTGTNVGIAAAWSNVATRTSAFVGDNSSLVSGSALANAIGLPRGSIETLKLSVLAQTTGANYSLSVAGAVSSPNTGEKGRVDKARDSISGFTGGRAQKHKDFAAANDGVLGKLSGAVGSALGKLSPELAAPNPPAGQTRDFSLSGAGSVTGATISAHTAAYLDGATIRRLGSTGAVEVTVDATNDSLISVTSGAASIALAGQDSSGSSAAVAGAVAVAVNDGRTSAAIRNSTLTGLGATRVRALASGQQIVIGLGLAVNTNANSAVSIAGSVSFGFIFDNVNAEIADSTLTAANAAVAADVDVKAYQNTDIGIGGLAVSVATQGSGGFGLALTGTVMADSVNPANPDGKKAVSARISGSTLTGFRDLTVDAATLSRIMAGAGAVGVAPNGLGLTGAIVFNDISNTTHASITGDSGDEIDVTGNVLVRSGSKREAEIAAELSAIIRNTAIASGFDFSQNVFDTDSTGSVIFSLAGAVGVGKNSAGISLLYNGVRHVHEALIDGASVEADGDIAVAARDDTKIIGTAAGVSVSTGEFAGAGSIVVNLVNNRTSAAVTGADAVLSARDISVLASNTSFIAGGAGSVGVGASAQGTGLGVSLISGAIANTTEARVDRATLTATRDVGVAAESTGEIVTFAVSVGVGGTVGIAGSVAASIAANDTSALVRGASLTANNNVIVSAKNTDSIHTAAGAVGVSLKAAGVGISVVTNVVQGETVAAVEGLDGEDSTIVARGAGTAATIDNGIVATPYAYDAEDIAKSLVTLSPDLSNGTRSVSGLAVSAVSQQSVGSAALAVAVGVNVDTLVSVAGAVSPVVNVLGGTTEARIVDASVNRTGAGSAEADVTVIAASNTFVQNAVIAAAGSTGAAGAGGFVSNIMERDTTARIDGSMIGDGNSVGAVSVVSNAVMDSMNLVAGLSVGPVGAAGSMVVNVFDAATTAQFKGGSLDAASLDVKANSDTGFMAAAGSGAAGSIAVAGAMNVSVNLGSTRALVGSGDADTTLVLDGDLDVHATSRDEQRSFVVGGAVSTGGGGFAVAGMLNLSVLMSDTIASVNRLSASSMQNVWVKATNVVDLLPVTGGFGISVDGVGVGAAANVMLTKSTIASEILNSSFTARGTLKVEAFGERRIEMVTATLGAGSSAGIGAALGIIVAGIDMSDEASDELGNTLSSANDQANQSTESGFEDAPGGTDNSGLTRQDLVESSVGSTKRDSVSAKIAGGTITAGATSVLADSRLETSNIAFGAGIGGGVGVGAALGFTFVNQDVSASVAGTLAVDSLSVKALSGMPGSDPAVSVKSYAGAGALAGALGAAVAVASVESDIYAGVGGTVTGGGSVEILAEDRLVVESEAVGATAAGGVAIGISLALSNRDADVTAEIASNGAVTGASGVSIAATSLGSASATGIAGAGGLIGAGVGASATALETTRVLAQIGAGADLTGIGASGVTLAARAAPNARAEALGVAVGGQGAVGASVALAQSDTSVRALVGNGVTIGAAGKFSVTADLLLASGDSLYAKSTAGAGSVFFSAQASVGEALMRGRVEASIGTDSTIGTGSTDTEVKARSRTRQRADVTGVAVGGILALGATVSEAKSDTETKAAIGDRADVTGNDLTIEADGTDENIAIAMAGGGGIISGSAAVVTTDTVSTTTASLGSGSASDDVALTGKLTVKAAHLGTIGGSVDSINAGIVGASGAIALHSVDSTVSATLADNAYVGAADLEIDAANRTHRLFAGETGVDLRTAQPHFNGDSADWNLNSGSGGIINLPAGASRMTVSHETLAALGANARVQLASAGARSAADLSAYNELIVHDKVKLDSGGAIALADTRTYLDVTKNEASVSFGEGASLVLPNGNIRAAAFDNAHLDLRAASTTYGLAGAPSGAAEIDYVRDNRLTVGTNARVEAGTINDVSAGTVRLSSGAALDGSTLSRITARATLDLYNNTAIPIPTVPNPIAKVSGNSTLSIAGGSTADKAGVRAAGDIFLTASRGLVDASAVGTGKDIYREALAEIASGISELFGGDPVSFDYKGGETRVSGLGIASVDGAVLTGIGRNKSVTIDYARQDVAGCLVSTTICLAAPVEGEIGYTVENGLAIGTSITTRIAELRQLLSDYGSDPVASAAYRGEITFLEAKLVALGLSRDGSSGSFTLPTELELARAQLILNQQVLNGLGSVFDSNAAAVGTAASNVASAGSDIASNADAVSTAVTNGKSAANSIVSSAAGLSKYGGGNASANAADVTEINRLAGLNDTLAGDIASARTSLATARQAIADAQANIAAQQTTIVTKTAAIAAKPYGTPASEIAALQAEIETARQSIASSTATISSNLPTVKTHSDTIATKSSQVAGNLDSIKTRQASIVARSNGGTDDDNGRMTTINGLASNLETARSSAAGASSTIATRRDTIGTQQTNSSTSITGIGGYSSARSTLGTTISTIETGIANGTYSNTNSSAPTTSAVTIEDTVVRLGDIIVSADRLIGSGTLSAPGDATISIVNNTAHTLKLGNLTVDSESGGRVLFNGVSIENKERITALNAGGVAADFANIVTAVSQGAVLPSMSITSNYTVDSASFYDPTASELFKKTPRPAPDIILMAGKTLRNVRGAVNITSQAGNIYMQGATEAGSVNILAKNGDFVQGFVYGFQHVGGDPAGGVAIGNGITANGAVNISARFLNINSVIQSGIANWALTIPVDPQLTASANDLGVNAATLAGYLQAYRNATASNPATANPIFQIAAGLWFDASGNEGAGRLYFTTAYAQANRPAGKFVLHNAVGNIGVSYDVAQDRFVVDGTNVRGGFIQIFGQIMNTSDSGAALNVLDGYGQIAISNLDGRDVVIGQLDTGEDATGTGRGTAGRIEITDIYSVDASNLSRPVTAVRTVFTRDAGVVNSARQTGYISADGIFVSEATTNASGSGRAFHYDPQTGLRYNYTTGVDNSTKTVTHYYGTEYFGNSDWRTDPDIEIKSRTTTTLSSYRLADGTYVSIGTAPGEQSVTYSNGTRTETLVDDWRDCNWWTLCIAADYNFIIEEVNPTKTITTSTLRADSRIAVNFIGSDTGTVSVTSAGSVLLSGAVNNKTGGTTIRSTGGSILRETSTALVTSRDITLAAAGSVGSLDTGKAIAVTLTGGKLNASAGDGNVVVDANSDLGIGVVTAAGSVSALEGRVVLSASGSITGDANSLIQAPRVELTSRYGSIGSTSSLLTVNTGFSANSADRPFGDPERGAVLNTYYGLKASASGDIGIQSGTWAGNADGTILLDRVVSSGGDVRLKTDGAILDNNPIQSIDTRTYGELLDYWNSLGLLAGTENDAKTAAVIRSFETQVSSEKRIYDQLAARSGLSAYDPAYVYAMTQVERLAFEASLKLAEPSLTGTALADRVAEFEAGQTERYHRIQASLGTLGGSFDAATGAYTASAAETAARTQGAVWTDRQLAFSLSPGALKTVTGTNPVIKAANVSGRIVTLEAGKGLGEIAGTVEIPLDILPEDLTDAQKIALATAERSDFLARSGSDPIRISAVRMLNFEAAEQLNATLATGANAYLASLGDARLGTISVPGELRLKVRGSIVNASSLSDSISAGSYILEASGGGIGYSRGLDGTLTAGTLRITPVNTGGTPGTYAGTVIARAAETISLSVDKGDEEDEKGDANLDTVYSRKDVKVIADGSIRNANGDALINVLGQTVDLQSLGGSIGSAGNRLNVGNGLGGFVTADASGAIHLFAPDGNHLTLDTLIARGGVLDVLAGNAANPASAADILLTGTISAATDMRLTATGRIAADGTARIAALAGDLDIAARSLRMLTGAQGEASGTIAVTTRGDALVTGLKAGGTGRDAVTVTSTDGRILAGTAANRIDIEATNGGIVLTAEAGIGGARVANDTLDDAAETQVANPLRLKSRFAAAETETGDLALRFLDDVDAVVENYGGSIDLAAEGDLTSALIAADVGSVRIEALKALDIASLLAGGSLDASSTQSAAIGTATTGGDLAVQAGGALTAGTLRTLGTSGNGDVRLRALGGSLEADIVEAAGGLDASAFDALILDAFDTRYAQLSAGGSMRLGTGVVDGAALITAGGRLDFTRLDLGSAGIDVAGGVSGTELTVDGDAALRSQETVAIDRSSVGGAFSVGTGRDIALASVSSGTLGLSAGGSIRLGTGVVTNEAVIVSGANLDFTRLDAGSAGIDAGGAVSGTTLAAAGNASIRAASGVGIDRSSIGGAFGVAAGRDIALGSVSSGTLGLSAGGSIGLGQVRTAAAFDADAGGTLTVTEAISGGSQRLSSTGDLVFAYLKTLGIATDRGDIRLVSRQGSVLGGEADANGDLFIDARNALTFSRLRSGNDMSLRAGGAVRGTEIEAGGELTFDFPGAGPLTLATVRSNDLRLSSGGPLTITNAFVGNSARFETPSITVSKLTYTGLEQLILSITGYRGAVADSAAMAIASAKGIQVDELRVVDSRFSTDATRLQIAQGYVPGSMQWLTPARTVWMDNRSQRPVLGNDIQLYDPGFAFSLQQDGLRTLTTGYVVRYGSGTQAQMVRGGIIYPGASFVRDFERVLQDPSNDLPGLEGRERSFYRLTVDAMMDLFRRTGLGSVVRTFEGPAVNMDNGSETREEAELR